MGAQPALRRPRSATIAGREVVAGPAPRGAGDDPALPPPAGISGEEAGGPAMTVGELLRDSAFSAPLQPGRPTVEPCWTLWGRGDVQAFRVGSPDADTYQEGDLKSGWLGVDVRAGKSPVLVGVAVSRSVGSARYAYDDGARHGMLDTGVNALHAYLRRPVTARDVGYWGLLGVGSGTARDTPAGKSAEESDLALFMGAVGVRGVLAAREGPPLATAAAVDAPDAPPAERREWRSELALYGDLGAARLATAPGNRAIDGLDVVVWRARAGAERGPAPSSPKPGPWAAMPRWPARWSCGAAWTAAPARPDRRSDRRWECATSTAASRRRRAATCCWRP